jgi:hypothetical protein
MQHDCFTVENMDVLVVDDLTNQFVSPFFEVVISQDSNNGDAACAQLFGQHLRLRFVSRISQISTDQ